LFEDSEDDLI